MRYKIHTKYFKAWDAMLEAIDQAEKSIYMEMYIFLDDTENHDFIGKLQEKARQGIKVVIVADSFGSGKIKEETIASLKKSGIEFIFFSNWLRHIHRKILVIDEKIAFLGGMNIGKEFTHWNDLQLQLRGRIVKPILKSFAYTYEMAGGKDREILKYRKRTFVARFRFWIIEHWPIKNIYSLKESYREKISGATTSIRIVTPYFTPPRWLIALLDDAIRRNVRVEIIIPKKGDLKFADRINFRYMFNLSQSGIDFYLANEMNHAKLLLIDGKQGLIGSQNVDLLSFHLNSEVGIFFNDKKLVEEVGAIMDDWKKNSEKFKPAKYKMKLLDYAILTLSKILHPIL